MKVKNDHRSKFSNLRNWKEEAWKNQGFNGIRTRDLRVTGAWLYQLSYEATHWERWSLFNFKAAKVDALIFLMSAKVLCTAPFSFHIIFSLFSIVLFPSAPCALLKCDFYAECSAQLDGSLQCVCPTRCPLFFNPVCGSDGYTYPNQCTLQVESCKTRTRITVVKQGQCGA